MEPVQQVAAAEAGAQMHDPATLTDNLVGRIHWFGRQFHRVGGGTCPPLIMTVRRSSCGWSRQNMSGFLGCRSGLAEGSLRHEFLDSLCDTFSSDYDDFVDEFGIELDAHGA